MYIYFTELGFCAEIIHNYEIVKPSIVQHGSSGDEVSSKWCKFWTIHVHCADVEFSSSNFVAAGGLHSIWQC